MAIKFNIGTKSGKTYKIESEAPAIIGKELGETIQGLEISPDLEGYEFEITGASDKSGFTSMKEIKGMGIKKILLKKYGKALKKKPRKEGKKKITRNRPKGLRMRKSVRGKVITKDITQINLKISKKGSKKIDEIFTPKEEEKQTPAQ